MRVPRGRSAVVAGWMAAGLGATACGGVTEPSTDLSGVWSFEYFSRSSRPVPGSPEVFYAECGGLGTLSVTQVGAAVRGEIPLWGYCQSGGGVADSFGLRRLLIGSLQGDRLVLEMLPCRYEALVGRGLVEEVSGTVTCALDSQTTGEWRMTRTK